MYAHGIPEIIDYRIPLSKKALSVLQETKLKSGRSVYDIFKSKGIIIIRSISIDETYSYLDVKTTHANGRLVISYLSDLDNNPKKDSIKRNIEDLTRTPQERKKQEQLKPNKKLHIKN